MSIYTPSYVYKITNKITNQFYIGYRSRNQKLKRQPIDDLWVKYFTSSFHVKNIIKEFGVESFNCEILFLHEDSLVCWAYEQILIKQFWGNNLLINRKYHDPNSNIESIRKIGFHSSESKLKMSIVGKGRKKSEEHKRNISIANTGNIASPSKRKKLSEFHKGKSPSNLGKSPPKYPCIHCGKIVSNANLSKWHGNNCKLINPDKHNKNCEHIKNLASSK